MKPHSINRRDLLRHACCGVAGLAVGLGMPHAFAATGNRTELTPDQVLGFALCRYVLKLPLPATCRGKKRLHQLLGHNP